MEMAQLLILLLASPQARAQGDPRDPVHEAAEGRVESPDAEIQRIRREIARSNRPIRIEPFKTAMPKIIASHPIVLLGERHDRFTIRNAVIKSLPLLKEAGITHLCLELPMNLQAEVDQYQYNKNPKPLAELEIRKASIFSRERWDLPPADVKSYFRLMRAAMDARIKVVLVEMADKDRVLLITGAVPRYPTLKHENLAHVERDYVMAKKIAEIYENNKEARLLFLTGLFHSQRFILPSVLTSVKKIPASQVFSLKAEPSDTYSTREWRIGFHRPGKDFDASLYLPLERGD